MTNIVFWQWVNQTYNAAFNYANRNATVANDMSGIASTFAGGTLLLLMLLCVWCGGALCVARHHHLSDGDACCHALSSRYHLLACITVHTESYAAATSVAVGVAVSLDQLVKRATNMSPGLRGFVQKVRRAVCLPRNKSYSLTAQL